VIRSTINPTLLLRLDTEDNGGGGSTEEKPAEETPETGDQGGSGGDGGGAANKEEDLPEWAQKELARVRKEAADRRVKLREAEERLSKAKTPEEIEAATKELRESNEKLERELLITKVAKDFDLPDEIAARLVGEDEAALRKDAEVLKNLVVHRSPGKKADPPRNLRGGLDPSEQDNTPDDPAELAKRYGRRFRR